METDNDPDSEANWLAGWSESNNANADNDPSNFVFDETIRDLWAEAEFPDMVPIATGRDRISAHEALHRFFGWHGSNPESDEGIMDPETLMTEEAIVLTPGQIKLIQQRKNPR